MHKSKTQIVDELRESFTLLCETALLVPQEDFNTSRDNKWTTGENIQHIITATRMTSLAYALPKLLSVLLYGKPRHNSHTYDNVVGHYTSKLQAGAKATGVYVPKHTGYNQKQLVGKLKNEGEKLVKALDEKWSEEELDKYQVAHPILKNLTHRELAYFTIYHNGHHQNTIEMYYTKVPSVS